MESDMLIDLLVGRMGLIDVLCDFWFECEVLESSCVDEEEKNFGVQRCCLNRHGRQVYLLVRVNKAVCSYPPPAFGLQGLKFTKSYTKGKVHMRNTRRHCFC